MQIIPFAPHYGSNKVLSCTATPQSTTISNHNQVVSITNMGPNIAFVRIGNGSQSTVTANNPAIVSKADFPVPPGSVRTITKPIGNNGNAPMEIGYVSPDGTATLHVMTGNGGV